MKKLYVSLLIIMLISMLSGCSADVTLSTSLHNLFVEPFIYLISLFVTVLGGSYGLAIVMITIIIRFTLMPILLMQQKKQKGMQEKIAKVKPEVDKIKEKLNNSLTKSETNELKKELSKLYTEQGINPFSIGCLPFIIQTPILMGFYYALKGSEAIATHQFLWFSLGTPDLLLAGLAGLIYLINHLIQQAFVSKDATNSKTTIFMGMVFPIFIFIFSINAPAVLPLYWSVAGIFMIIQTLIQNKLQQHSQLKATIN
ncbi:membrane protein insertase YidC [Pseudalkalibacillus sp. JSM 102089]|uniref:membrane protein insertase YidC n=1 Tax=Pseudalkalibacillus sp. JSM 102089 TaxID=3229856 RepID=UPI0035266153